MTKTERETNKLVILKNAAELILKTGNPQVDIEELASRCKVLRQTIYSWFGSKDIKSVIFDSIVSRFLDRATDLVNIALQTIDPRRNTPTDRLQAVLRGILAAFKQESLFGKVTLRHLNLGHESFAQVQNGLTQLAEVIKEAREKGQIETGQHYPGDWKVGYVLFSVAYGLIRTMCFKEELKPKEEIGKDLVTGTLLLILGGYCTDEVRKELGELSLSYSAPSS